MANFLAPEDLLPHSQWSLAGASVLVAEDEALIGMEIEILLSDAGCSVLGPYASAADALASLQRQRPDAALLDLKLTDGLVTPVADALTASGVPFILLSGSDDPDLPEGLTSAPRASKPYPWAEVEQKLRHLLHGQAGIGQPTQT